MRKSRIRLPWHWPSLLLLLAVAACIHSSWERARAEDTLAGYSQFIRDHPGSGFVNDAQERMAYLRVKTYHTRESFEEFQKQYPHSALLTELRELVEPLYFEAARSANTPAAYGEYLRAYPEGALAEKARGNRTYVEEVLPDLDEAKLRAFAEQNAQSDFKEEASRTLELLDLQREGRIRSLGVRVDVSPNVVQPTRVRQGFAALFAQVYRERGVKVSLVGPDATPGAGLDAWANVEYREAPASGVLGAATTLAYCRVRLYHGAFEEPVWDRSFEAPAEHLIQGASGRDKTIFANKKFLFWRQFFVPVATWPVSQMQVQAQQYLEDVQAVDVRGERAALLLERGGVDFLDVSSPPAARVIDRYRRELDLSEWHGIRLLREDLAITFGTDGMELVRRTESSAERLAKFDGPAVGAVHAAVLYDENTLLFGGTLGLYAVRMNRFPLTPQRLLDGEVVGVETSGSHVVVVRPGIVEVALPKHLLLHLTEKKISLGKFRAARARLVGDQLFLLGQQGVLNVNLANAQQPKVTRLLTPNQIGRISDLDGEGSLLYLLGERGLQVAVIGEDRIEDFVQVASSRALAIRGRFALLVGNKGLEVLDLSPYAMLEPQVRSRADAVLPAAHAPENPAHSAAPASDELPPLPLDPERPGIAPSAAHPTSEPNPAAPADSEPAPGEPHRPPLAPAPQSPDADEPGHGAGADSGQDPADAEPSEDAAPLHGQPAPHSAPGEQPASPAETGPEHGAAQDSDDPVHGEPSHGDPGHGAEPSQTDPADETPAAADPEHEEPASDHGELHPVPQLY